MDVFEKISRNLIIPIYNRKYGIRYYDILKQLQKSQFLPIETIRENQWTKIKSILEHSYSNNTFYQNHFKKANVHPRDIKNWDDYSKIPFLTKDDIRANSDDIISKDFCKEDMMYKRTGGSTGVPIRLYVDQYAMNFKRAATHRHNEWANYLPGMKRAALWGDTDKEYGFREKLYINLYERTIYLDTLKMDEIYLREFVDKMLKFKPKILFGHGHSLYFFAKYLKDSGCRKINLDGIISTAETLSPEERLVMEELFGNIIYDRYGCEELSIIASECDEHDGLHINAEGLFVEVIGGDSTTPGELVITDLVNKGMPFIRYKVGDMATVLDKPCACGRGLPRLGKVFGRVTDILYTPEGKKISGVSILDTFIIHIKGFKQMQIIQNELNCIEFKIIKDITYNEESLRILSETVPKIFGKNMNLKIEFVDKISRTPRGKYQFTICNLKMDKT
ncbi:MAG: phenylacetate--CoA ligase family protein [candidate division Zixibacteria bacterium]|nr:phenylacetate--CoA ligase family protein [candidate division Zixibacteria bacterium]